MAGGFGVGRRSSRRRGFTLIELLVALTLGAFVITAAVAYMLRELRTLTGSEIRQSLGRNTRYVGITLQHDIQQAGIEIPSTAELGSIDVWPGSAGDTLVVLYVPYEPRMAPARQLVSPLGTSNPLPPGGTCGVRCIEVTIDAERPLELAAGDLVRVVLPGTWRLALIEGIAEASETSVALSLADTPLLLRRPAGIGGGLQLDRYETYVQKVSIVGFFIDDEEQLQRAHRLSSTGALVGDILAYDVEQFDATLVFADGDVAERANPLDEDTTNDYDDIVAVRVRSTIRADRVDPRVNRGEPLRRSHEWTVTPRNLRH
jgi:prepilin-type N-terminal cleavage/methylation domain-containing protein